MSFYEGTYFFLWLAIVLLFGYCLLCRQVSRKGVILTSSVFFIWKVLSDKPQQLLLLLGFVVFQWLLIQTLLYLKEHDCTSKRIFHLIISLSIAPIVLTRLGEVIPMRSFGFLGISYLTFRSAQILIEIWDDLIKDIHVTDYLCFMLFFPSLSSGPIDRSRRFTDNLHEPLERAEQGELAAQGLYYLIQGYVYKMVVSQLLYDRISSIMSADKTLKTAILYMYLYGLYLFFDFCGYSRMAVGSAYILGIRLPKNFDMPFISENIIDFWNRWHISLSHWLRDFVFNRYTMAAIKNKWHDGRLKTAQSAYLFNMMVMGAWHGLSVSYLLYGFYHGVLLGVSNYYIKKNQFHKKHRQARWYRLLMIVITFHLVMFGFFIFSGKFVESLQFVWRKILL